MARLPEDWHEREAAESVPRAIAWFPGRCGWCDEGFEEGDPISKVDGQWVHRECEEEAA